MPGADVVTRAEALRASSRCSAARERRHRGRGRRVAAHPRRCAAARRQIAREATEALAVHHEHRLRDLPAARSFALQSLSVQATSSRRDATQHRLARLDRKMGDAGAVPVPLF